MEKLSRNFLLWASVYRSLENSDSMLLRSAQEIGENQYIQIQ
ncbi:hypothetical protein PC128_g27593 [Phytophthora cactorum]|nr:hypothetical protein PC128_g27593 [Phytophthora cactorum]